MIFFSHTVFSLRAKKDIATIGDPEATHKVKEQLLVNEFMYSIAGDARAVVLHSRILFLFFLRCCSVHILKIFVCFGFQCEQQRVTFYCYRCK